jgi:hypothetical protein
VKLAPGRIKDHDLVGLEVSEVQTTFTDPTYSCEIETYTASKGADKQDEVIAIGILKFINHLLPPRTIDLASQKIVIEARD